MNEEMTRQIRQQLKNDFWQIFQSNEYCPIYQEWKEIISRGISVQRQLLNQHFQIWSASFCNNKHITQVFVERNFEEILSGRMKVSAPEMKNWYKRIRRDAKSKLHHIICNDVIDFLSSSDGENVLYRCFVVAWADAVHNCQQGRGGKMLPPDAFHLGNLHHQMNLKHSQITYQLALLIATSPWSEKLGESSNSSVKQQIPTGVALKHRSVGFTPRY